MSPMITALLAMNHIARVWYLTRIKWVLVHLSSKQQTRIILYKKSKKSPKIT